VGRRRFYERAYRSGTSARWDTGVTPPEVVSALDRLEPGRALDLGCGTGTNVIYLVQHGWFATGVDFSAHAIESARRKSEWVSGATFYEGDVTRLSELGIDGPFDFVLDIGCYHGIPRNRQEAYAHGVARVTRPGALLLMFAFGSGPVWLRHLFGGRRTREPEIRRRFGGAFELQNVELGKEPPGAAYYSLVRRSS
jgi:SAM-dependent methyltransferase